MYSRQSSSTFSSFSSDGSDFVGSNQSQNFVIELLRQRDLLTEARSEALANHPQIDGIADAFDALSGVDLLNEDRVNTVISHANAKALGSACQYLKQSNLLNETTYQQIATHDQLDNVVCALGCLAHLEVLTIERFNYVLNSPNSHLLATLLYELHQRSQESANRVENSSADQNHLPETDAVSAIQARGGLPGQTSAGNQAIDSPRESSTSGYTGSSTSYVSEAATLPSDTTFVRQYKLHSTSDLQSLQVRVDQYFAFQLVPTGNSPLSHKESKQIVAFNRSSQALHHALTEEIASLSIARTRLSLQPYSKKQQRILQRIDDQQKALSVYINRVLPLESVSSRTASDNHSVKHQFASLEQIEAANRDYIAAQPKRSKLSKALRITSLAFAFALGVALVVGGVALCVASAGIAVPVIGAACTSVIGAAGSAVATGIGSAGATAGLAATVGATASSAMNPLQSPAQERAKSIAKSACVFASQVQKIEESSPSQDSQSQLRN